MEEKDELIFCMEIDFLKLLIENGYVHLLNTQGNILEELPFLLKPKQILDIDLINIELFEIYKRYNLGVRKMANYFFLKETKERTELVKLSKSSISRLEKKYSNFDSKEHYKKLERLRNSYNGLNMFSRAYCTEYQDLELKEFSNALNNILSQYVIEQNKEYIIKNLKSGKVDLKYQKMYKYKFDFSIYELVKKPSVKRFLRNFKDISSIKKSDIKLLEQIQKSIIFIKAEETDFKYNYMLFEIYKIAIWEDIKTFENTFYPQYIKRKITNFIENHKKSTKSH